MKWLKNLNPNIYVDLISFHVCPPLSNKLHSSLSRHRAENVLLTFIIVVITRNKEDLFISMFMNFFASLRACGGNVDSYKES